MSDCDYVIVGSGSAAAAMRVTLLEAGGDPLGDAAGHCPGMPEDYQVPGFHPLASEDPPPTPNQSSATSPM